MTKATTTKPAKPKASPEPSPTQSWDEMLAEVAAKARTTVIQGVTVRVPTETTMRFELRLAELSDSGSEDDIRSLVTDLYGVDVLDQWVANGMTQNGFLAALGWGLMQAKGQNATFMEAYQLVLDRQGNQQAANRASRRAAAKPRSKSTGGRSKATSAPGTTSRPRKSST